MTSAHTTETPVSGNIDNGAAITTGVKYVFDEDGTVSAIRFWVPTTNTGTYTVGFYAVTQNDDMGGTGTLLASAAVASGSVTANSWAQVPITPQAVLAGHTYLAARHASSGRYVATAGAFFAGGISNGGVTAIQSGSDPNVNPGGTMRNGTFNEGASLAYPATFSGQPDYFVDVVYSAAASEVTGTAVADLGSLTATAAGIRTVLGAALADLVALSASAVGLRTVTGVATADLGQLAATGLGAGSARGAGQPLVTATAKTALTTTTSIGQEVT